MKKRSIFCILLAISMLLGSIGLFSSCAAKDGEVKLSGSAELDLAEYALVYAESEQKTATFKSAVTDFTQKVIALTGKRIAATPEARATEQAKEILIGDTSRAQTQKALKRIKGDGFIIEVIDEKLVIVGTTPLYTMKALDYLAENYMTESASSTLTLAKRALAKNCESVCIADEDEAYYTFLLDKDLDNDSKHFVVPGAVGDYRDYPCIAMTNVTDKVKQLTGLRSTRIQTVTDDEAAAENEFSVGIVDRAYHRECLETLNGNGYGIFVRGGHVMVTAWNDAALTVCQNTMLDILSEGLVTREDGKKAIMLPADFELTGFVGEAFVTDFPKPAGAGVLLYNTQDVSDNALQYLYTGEGVSEAAYQAYYNELLAAGYTVVTQSEVEGSRFCTLANESAGVSLYVAYNAYAHAEKYELPYAKMLRVISSPLADAALPDAKLLTQDPSYVRKTDPKITAIEIPGTPSANGMSYILTLEDGSFIVLDGGGVADNNNSDGKLFGALCNLHESIFPEKGAVSESNPVHISAWIITHSHWDHYDTFRRVMESPSKRNKLKIDYILGNYPSASELQTEANEDVAMMDGLIDSYCGINEGDVKFVKVHTGHKYYLANVELEALVTHEDVNPNRIDTSNDTCTVFRFSIKNTQAPTNDPTTIIFTGDANRYQSRFMCATFGDHLQSDMVQVAHHGAVGCESDFYDTVAPTVLWWPVVYTAFVSQTKTDNKGKSGAAGVDYKLVYETPSVKYIYVSDTYCTTLTIGVNGPEYTGIYDVLTGENILYNGEQIRQK